MYYKLTKLFDMLESTASINEKEKIIHENRDNEYFLELLYRNLNPNQLFQFNKIPCEWESVSDKFIERTNYGTFVRLLDDLYTRKYTGNEAREHVKQVFRRFDKNEFKMYSKILLKGPIGVTATTVNKIVNDFIPDFKLMLAPNKIADVPNLKYPCFIQPKLDGYRAVFKETIFISRTGKPFGNKNIPDYFSSLESIKDYVLDGELYIHGLSFNKLQTILNKEDSELPKGLKYVVYDCVPLRDWEKQQCNIPYEERLKKARELINTYIGDYTKVIDIASDLVDSPQELLSVYKKHLNKGYEGAMIKSTDGKYQWKRTTVRNGAMLKLKPFKSEDLKVTGIYDGEGKFEGMAGGVVVDFNGVSVRCGSGFDVSLRKEMAKQPSKFIGKVAEIKYFEVTEDGSLRFPIFTRWREEKE